MNMTKNSHSIQRLHPLTDRDRAHIVTGWKPIKSRIQWRAVTQQDVDVELRPRPDIILIPLIAEAHPIGTRTTNTADAKATHSGRSTIDVAGKTEIGVIMITGHIRHINTEPGHHLERSIHREQVIHPPLIVLLMTPPRTGEVSHQEHTI
jgi:hypothetical protein